MFELDKFNVIEDDNFYYAFRALNRADHNDMISGITLDETGNIGRIRTDRERFEDENGTALYSEGSEISLEEVWNHIKMKYSKETNCISLSTNSNVSLDYGASYFDEYAIVKIPKSGSNTIYPAGKYMINEVNKKIYDVINNKIKNNDYNLSKLLDNILKERNNNNVIEYVKKFFAANNLNFSSVASRFQDRQYFNNEQQLEYNIMVARLTILEFTGYLPSVLPTQMDNSSLLATIGNAFSSGEVVNYKDIDKKDFIFASKTMMNLISIVQQLKDKNNTPSVEKLEKTVIELFNNGYDIKEVDGSVVLTNGINSRTLNIPTSASILKNETIDESVLSVDNIYNLSEGKIDYLKAKKTAEFVYYLALSKKKTIEYSSIIKELTGDDSLSERINKEVFSIDSRLIDRGNNSGYKLCESVNIGMSNEKNLFYSLNDQKKFINEVLNLDLTGINKLLNNNVETFVTNFSKVIEGNNKTKEEFYASSIIDLIDYKKIFTYSVYKDNFNEKEIEQLINSLAINNIDKLYNAFVKLNIPDYDISAYIINLLLEKEYKGYSFEELCNLDNIDDFIKSNLHKLNLKINPMTLNEFFGNYENDNKFEGTNLVLRDYQMNAKENADAIYESGRKFCGVVLPTGAGKSFVIIAQMLERRNENIVYIAPRIGIIRQLKKHIVKYVAGLNPVDYTDLEQDLIVKKYFPHFECYCYQGLNPDDEIKLKKYSADFIVLDEIHHLGANRWNPAIRKLLLNNKSSKVLGVTATPERDDRTDNNDMLKELALLLDDYTEEELIRKDYLASNMSLVEGIQEGYIVCPNIVSFDYYLDETDDYKQIVNLVGKVDNPRVNIILKKKFHQVEELINNTKVEGVDKIFKQYITNKNGKFLLFIPRKQAFDGSDSINYIERYIAEFKKELALVDDNPIISYIFSTKNDNSETIREFEKDNVSGHLKVLAAVDMFNEGIHLEKLNGSFNERKISSGQKILKFQHLGRVVHGIDPNNPPKEEERPIVFDRYNNYYNLEFERTINKTNISSDLDKLKNVLFWIKKYGYIPQTDSTRLSEKRKALTLKKIKAKYEKYINSDEIKNSSLSEKYEIRQILSLGKNIDLWSMEFNPISKEEIRKIEHVDLIKVGGIRRSFLELCSSIKNTCGIEKLDNKERLELLRVVLDVLVEYNIELGPNYIKADDSLGDLLKNVSNDIKNYIYGELSIHGVDSNYAVGTEFYYIRSFFNTSRESLFSNYDNPDEIINLRKQGIILNGDDIIFTDSKGFFITKTFQDRHIITGTFYAENGFDVNGLNKYRFDTNGLWHNSKNELSECNPYGFNSKLININTNNKYDEYGFDIDGNHRDTNNIVDLFDFNRDKKYCKKTDNGGYYATSSTYDAYGYDIDGYNKDGFNRQGIHKDTGLLFDKNFFDRDHFYWKLENGKRVRTDLFLNEMNINYQGKKFKFSKIRNKYVIDSSNKRDEHGFYLEKSGKIGLHYITDTKYDQNGFDQDGYWHRYNSETKEYEPTGSKFNDDGWNIDGEKEVYNVYGIPSMSSIDEFGFDVNKKYHLPHLAIDSNGFVDFNGGVINYPKNTKKLLDYDVHGFDYYGIHRETGTFLNPEHFDRRGYWYKENENGELVNTFSHVDENGWTIDKRHLVIKYDYKTDKVNIMYPDVYDGYNSKGRKLFEKADNSHIYDRHGFNDDGIHYLTGTYLDPEGFDKHGFWYYKDETGEYVNSGKLENKDGWNIDHEHLTENTIDENGNRVIKFEKFFEGFDYKGKYHNSRGVVTDYNPQGFDYKGIHFETGTHLDPRNFDVYGYWYTEVNGKLVNSTQLYDSEGWNIYGVSKDTHRIIDKHGFNYQHMYRKKNGTFSTNDSHGFDYYGIHHTTGTKLNKHNFDQDGYWYFEKDGQLVNSGSLYNPEGYDINGLDKHYFRKSGAYNFGGKYNPDGFDQKGIHVITHKHYNLQGKDIDGNVPNDVDWNYLNRLKITDKICNKIDIESFFDSLLDTTKDQIVHCIDDDLSEIEDDGTFDMFTEAVNKNCLNLNNKPYTIDEIFEFLIEMREQYNIDRANKEKLAYYIYSSSIVNSDETVSYRNYL